MEKVEQTKPTKVSEEYNAVMAFSEWLHGRRSYIIIVQGNTDEENFCCVDGDIESLTNTVANGMLQHEVLKKMMMRASTAVLNARMRELGINLDLQSPGDEI